MSSIDFNKSHAQTTNSTCYTAEMYLCRGCSIDGLLANRNQVTLCSPIDTVE